MRDTHGDHISIYAATGYISVQGEDEGGATTSIWLDASNVEKFIKKIRKAIKESNNNG